MIDLLALACSFLSHTQLLSHVTKRLVDSFGNAPTTSPTVVQTAIPHSSAIESDCDHQTPLERTEPDSSSLVVAPPPERFIPLLQERMPSSGRLVVGAIVDDGLPYISWALVQPELPSIFAGPESVVGLLFAVLPESAATDLQLLQARDCGAVDGYRVVVLG